MIPATQIKVGMIIYYDGKLCRVANVEHITPGNWRGMVQMKMKSMSTGRMLDHRFRSEDLVEVATLERKDMEYLYEEGESFIFMDTATYDQIPMPKAIVGEAANYMLPNIKMTVSFCDGNPALVEPPNSVVLTVVSTDPPLKGATQSGSKKPAKLETGLMIQVPQFIVAGERVLVDTRDNTFLERAKD
ncbi:MAG: elongation factor P [Nitrospirae bacterium]|nr:elongation factor P [Nitrospirota bacterium]